MGDIHLVNMALAGVGIAVAAALLLAVVIFAVAAFRQHRSAGRARTLAAARVDTAARAATARMSAMMAATQVDKPAPLGPAPLGPAPVRGMLPGDMHTQPPPREPALR
jgi:hypothetical protein